MQIDFSSFQYSKMLPLMGLKLKFSFLKKNTFELWINQWNLILNIIQTLTKK